MTEIINVLPPILIVSSVVLLVAQKLSIPRFTSFIVSGILLGALSNRFGGGLELGSEAVIGVAEVGAAFLVFVTAMKLLPSRTRGYRVDAVKVSAVQILVQHLIGMSIGYMLGLGLIDSFFIGFAASISSTLVSTTVIQRGLASSSTYGRLTESITLVDDVVAALLTAAVVTGAASGTLVQVAAGSLMIFAGFALRRPVGKALESVKESSEIVLMTGVAGALTGGFIAQFLDVSAVVGAFSAGLLFSKAPENLTMLDSLESIEDFFSAVFFVSLGFLFQIPSGVSLLILTVIILSVAVVRPLVIRTVLNRLGYSSYVATKTGLSLDQVSEFTLLAALLAFQAGNLSTGVFQAVISAGAITLVTADFTTVYSERIYELLPDSLKPEKTESSTDLKDHTIIVGYGTIGREAAEAFDNALIVSENPVEVKEAESDGFDALHGSTTEVATWGRAGIKDASTIVSTTGRDRDAENSAVQGLPCYLVTNTDSKASKLLQQENVKAASTVEGLASERAAEQVRDLIEEG